MTKWLYPPLFFLSPTSSVGRRKCAFFSFLTLLFFLLKTPYGEADELTVDELAPLSLQELTTVEIPFLESAGFFKMLSTTAPGNTTVISEEEIRRAPAIRLRDLYDMYVPGVHIGEHPFNLGLYGSRGLMTDNNAKTLFMFDGQGVNYRSHGYAVGMEWPFLGDLKSIEIVNGPGSIVHGSGAINGFVFMSPKNGKDNPGPFFDYTYGVREKLHRIETGYGLSYGAHRDLYVYGGFAAAEGFQAYTYGAEKIPDETLTLDKKVFGQNTPAGKVGLYWNHENVKANLYYVETNYLIPAIDSYRRDGYLRQSSLVFGPRVTLPLSNEELLELRGAAELYDIQYNHYNPPPRENRGNDETHIEGRVTLRSIRFDKHSAALGGLIGRRNFQPGSLLFSSMPTSYTINTDMDWTEYGLFTEDIIDLSKRAKLSLGTRYDRVNYGRISVFQPEFNESSTFRVSSKDRFSSRIAASYQLQEDTTVKASFQQGFHYPDALDFGVSTLGNARLRRIGYTELQENLRPESLDSYEIGISHQFPQSRSSLSLNVYYNIYKDLLQFYSFTPQSIGQELYDLYLRTYQREPGTVANAQGDIASLGGELSASWNFLSNAKLNISYALAEPRQITNETDPTFDLTDISRSEWKRYPQHQIKGNLTTSHYNNRLTTTVNIIWETGVEDFPNLLDQSTTYNHRGRTEVNAAVLYKLTPDLTLKFSGRNVFGEKDPKVSYTTATPALGNLGNAERLWYLSLLWKLPS